MRTFFKWTWRLLLGLVLWSAGMGWYITAFSARDEARKADVAVVLGAAAWDRRPSPVLQERLNHALRLYELGTVKKLIFTGGYGENAVMAESEVARDYAIAQGIPAKDILIETVSHSTHGNVAEAARLMREKRLSSCVLVSDPLHMRRAVRMFRDARVPCFSSPTKTSAYVSWPAKAGFLAREVLFFSGYLVAGQ